MPNIRSSTDLRNNYNEISTFCHEEREPVFITKNGQGDLAVMSIEMYEMLCGKQELYRLLEEGRKAKEPAKDDLTGIIDYIVFGKLADFPTGYSRVPDDHLAAQGYRMIIIKNYIIFYTFNEDEKTVYIERILYGRRDWMWILRKEYP